MRSSERTRRVVVAFAVAATTCLGACGESVAPEGTDQKRQALESLNEQCDAPEGYDDCWEMYPEQAHTWQETIEAGTPYWREITTDSDGVKVVNIYANRLNAGVIPTAEGQGHYASAEEFVATMQDLFGVEAGERFKLRQFGTTVKLPKSRDGFAGTATGDFMFDALSDEEGRIFIDGEDQTEDLRPGFDAEPLTEDRTGSTSTSTQNLNLANKTHAKNTQMSGPDTSAVHSGIIKNHLNIVRVGATTAKFKRYGLRTRWIYRECPYRRCFAEYLIRVQRVEAAEIEAGVTVKDTDHPPALGNNVKNDAYRVSTYPIVKTGWAYPGTTVANDTACTDGRYSDAGKTDDKQEEHLRIVGNDPFPCDDG